jgi:uncharacterized membrane protein (UPF0136 family)
MSYNDLIDTIRAASNSLVLSTRAAFHIPEACSQMQKNKTALLSLSLFSLFVCIYAINAFFNYDASMVNDMVIYLKSAKALLHGKMTIDYPVYDLLKSHFPDMKQTLTTFILNPAGKQVSLVSIGISMILAPFLAVFGENAIWIVRIVWDIGIITGLFFTVCAFFKDSDRRSAWILAILAIAVYGTVINFRLTLRRDIACASLTTLATLFSLLGAQKKRSRYWHAALCCLCLTATVKITQAMLFLPFVLFFVKSSNLKNLRPRLIIVNVAVAAVLAVLIFTPFCIQNHVSSGHWYSPPQHAFAGHSDHLVERTAASLIAICKAQAYIYSPKGLPKWCALPFLIVAVLGMWAQRRSVFVRWWVIPFLLFQYVFMVYWFIPGLDHPYTYNIYLTPAYSLSVFLFICGIYSLVEKSNRRNLVLGLLTFVFLLPFFTVKVYRSLPQFRHAQFRLPQVHRLIADCEAVVPPKSVVLCDLFLCFPLDYFSNSYYFPPSQLDDSASTIIDKVSFLLEKNIPVFFFDYRGIEGSHIYQPRLESAFDLSIVKRDQLYYNYPNEFPVPPFSMYRISEKRRTN